MIRVQTPSQQGHREGWSKSRSELGGQFSFWDPKSRNLKIFVLCFELNIYIIFLVRGVFCLLVFFSIVSSYNLCLSQFLTKQDTKINLNLHTV